MQKSTIKQHKPNTLVWLCEQRGVNWHTFVTRYYYLGWDIERALSEPACNRDIEAHKRWREMLKMYNAGKPKKTIAEHFNKDLEYVTRAIRRARRENDKKI